MEIVRDDILQSYLRELSTNRSRLAVCFFVIAFLSLVVIYIMPRNFTSSSTVFADDGNILNPLMAGTAITIAIEDQARMAQEILFNQEFNDEILGAAGYNVSSLSDIEKLSIMDGIQDNTLIDNVLLGRTSLVTIANTSIDAQVAFDLTDRYTTLFIEESRRNKQEESRNAFEFIQKEAQLYLVQLEIAERNLADFRTEHNEGTLAAANNRVAGYRQRIETLQLDFNQLETEESSVEAVLAGEEEIVQDLTEINALRARIRALQITLDDLRAVYHEAYPDIVQIKTQIADLTTMLDSGQINGNFLGAEDLNLNQGVTTLHQELRSQLATIKTTKEATTSQGAALEILLSNEMERVTRISSTEAELAELTRDYNITLQFYNEMLSTMENARVSMHLDEDQQGASFVVQEPPVVALEADGIKFFELLIGSFILAIGVPFGLMVLYMEFDTRIRTDADWSEEWPPLLMVIPPLQTIQPQKISNKSFLLIMSVFALVIYAGTLSLKLIGFNPVTVLGMF